MKILVTGGLGYIGSHTVVALQQSGFEVLIIDDLSNSYISVLDRITEITGITPSFSEFNLCEENLVEEYFSRHKYIDAIIHFAAKKSVGESVKEPMLYYRNNLISLMNLLDTATKYHVNNFVFSSSCSVYGQPAILPVREDSPLLPAESPYANTKRISEEIIRDITKVSNVQAILLRYFNPIGAHDSALIGELPIGKPNNLVPVITQTAIGKNDHLFVWGSDYNTPDGTCIRDYIHVCDVAEAHVEACKRLMNLKQESSCEIFNLGTGKGNSVLEIIKTFENISGVKLPYKMAERRPGDVEQVYADATSANLKLGWQAKRTLEESVLSAWRWEKSMATAKTVNG